MFIQLLVEANNEENNESRDYSTVARGSRRWPMESPLKKNRETRRGTRPTYCRDVCEISLWLAE